MPITLCPLTGFQLTKESATIQPTIDATFTYEFAPIGKAKIAMPTYMSFVNNSDYRHPELAGICRNAFEEGAEPPLINAKFISTGIKNLQFPKTFTEKVNHLLKYMYKKGGKEFSEFEFLNVKDYPIAYATNDEEFNKIIKHLEDRYLITVDSPLRMSGTRVLYRGVVMTERGIEEAEKDLPKIPMMGLINQDITTGDPEIDRTINHAKKLFLEAPQTMDDMRSACESLSYVLEPLRKDCETMFSKSDVNDFFKIVNDFDIRHNKHTTKHIHLPEQLEWIFYSLLNTINTYTKLKGKKS